MLIGEAPGAEEDKQGKSFVGRASKMLGQNYLNFLKLFITKENNFKVNFEDDIIKSSCLTYQKQITNERLK
jgi:NAD(P) transhydrogenase subunit alpha